MTENQKMDRGTEAMRDHLDREDLTMMEVRQTKRGWCVELMGCEANTEFRYFPGGEGGKVDVSDSNQVFHSLEESSCCLRIFCPVCHPFKMEVKDKDNGDEILTVDRPLRCSAGACKCCCYQEAVMSSGGKELGTMRETCYFCVPSFKVVDGATNEPIYLIHPPTCGPFGMFVNCCAEGNPCCGKGCCKVPFHVFDANQSSTDNGAPHLGKIVKKPKSLLTEVFTDANAFEITFPENSTPEQKAMLIGGSIFLNAVFFEDKQEDNKAE